MKNATGNALFLILIAVALFAALSYAVTNSGRGGSGIDRENVELYAAEFVQYGALIRSAVDRMRIINGCRDTEITFEGNNGVSKDGDGNAIDYTNSNAPSDKNCHIFDVNGGGVPPKLMNDKAVVGVADLPDGSFGHPQSPFLLPSRVLGVGTDSGAAGMDVVLWLGRPKDEVCMRINEKLGIDNPSDAPPVDTFCASAFFTGTYADCVQELGDTVTALQGKEAMCVQFTSGEEYSNAYLQVLWAR